MKNTDDFETKFQDCNYSNRLLSKIISLNQKVKNQVDIIAIKKAIYYARKYHGDQRRQSGEPYYSHPLQVAYMISDYIFRTDILITSILHDTIEDTPLTKAMISEIFGNKIAEQVYDLTRIKENGIKISSSEMVETLWLEKKYSLLFIKQFDRLHNMQTIKAKSPEKIKKITQETLSTFVVLAASLEIQEIEDKIVKLCDSINKLEEDMEYS